MSRGTLDGFSETRLIIAIPSDLEKRLRRRLHSLCHTFWQNDHRIKVVVLANPKDSTNNAARIKAEIESANVSGLKGRVICAKQLTLADAAIKNLKKLDPTFRTCWADELSGDLLSSELIALQLTWEAQVVSKLQGWLHGKITHSSIKNWLRQFERLADDSYLWVGEALLKGMTFYPASELASAFLQCANSKKAEDIECCILRYKNGNSADILSSLIHKGFSSHYQDDVKIFNWLELIQLPSADSSNRYLVFEDGLFTGHETADILYALVGKAEKNQIKKLDDPKSLENTASEFIFVIATEVGLARLNAAIRETDANIKIKYSKLIHTLTDIGSEKLSAGQLYIFDSNHKPYIDRPDTYLHFGIFEDAELFPIKKKQKAIEICKGLGKSLWSSYLSRKKKAWSNELIDFCALGAGHMALAIIFAHSVPKSSLPVFWCHGKAIDKNGNPFDWMPLFPEAHPV